MAEPTGRLRVRVFQTLDYVWPWVAVQEESWDDGDWVEIESAGGDTYGEALTDLKNLSGFYKREEG